MDTQNNPTHPRRPPFDFPEQVHTARARTEVEICHDHVRLKIRQRLQGLRHRAAGEHVDAGTSQGLGQQSASEWLILNQQHSIPKSSLIATFCVALTRVRILDLHRHPLTCAGRP